MCEPYPGPRCSSHARANLEAALKTEDPVLIAQRRQEYLMTPDGIAELRSQGRDDAADLMQDRRNQSIAALKDAQAGAQLSEKTVEISRRMPRATVAQRHYLMDYNNSDANTYYARHSSEFDHALASIDFYADGEMADSRYRHHNFQAHYEDDLEDADRALEHGDLNRAENLMSGWETVRAQNLIVHMREAGVDEDIATRMVKDWRAGDRAGIYNVGLGLYGKETYDENNAAEHFLATQYFETQEYLDSTPGDTIRLYSGTTQMPDNRIGTLTLDPKIAQMQSPDGKTYYLDVPKSHVVSLPNTGLGSHVSQEATVFNPNVEDWRLTR